MADSITATYEFTLPEVGASDASWGGKLNANWTALDALLDGTDPISPKLTLGAWKIGDDAVTSTALELNKLDDVTGDLLTNEQSDTLTKGFDVSEFDAGTKTTGTFTPDPAEGNFQFAVNGGAHTLAPPATSCSMVIQYTNNGSAGTITTSGFTRVTGDLITTTSGHDFLFYIVRCNDFSHLNVVSLQ